MDLPSPVKDFSIFAWLLTIRKMKHLAVLAMLAFAVHAQDSSCGGLACCSGSVSRPVKDFQGRYLGLENGKSCAYKPEAVSAFMASVKPSAPTSAAQLSQASSAPTEAAAVPSSAPNAVQVAETSEPAPAPVFTQAPRPSTPLVLTPPNFTISNPNAANLVPCSEATKALSEDGAKCLNPFHSNTINSKDVADSMASTVVSCICSSRWNPKGPEMQSANQPTCAPPDGYTKTGITSVNRGCQSNPFDAKAIVDGLALTARLVSGENYVPFTQKATSGSISLMVAPLWLLISLLALNL